MFITQRHECHHRKPAAEHLRARTLRRQCKPYRKTDTPVGTYASGECRQPRKRHLRLCYLYNCRMIRLRTEQSGEIHQTIDKEESSKKITEIHHRPVHHNVPRRASLAHPLRHKEGIIPGKQFGTKHHHKDKTHRECRATKQFLQSRIGR